MQLKVNEIFYSIQGESTYAGYPCIFIRLTGCNLRCTYCDTRYAYCNGQVNTISQILSKIRGFNCHLVEITGGEPLFQKNTPLLIKSLLDQGYTVLVETNGSMDISVIPSGAITIMDIKCPSSGEKDAMHLENINQLSAGDEVKFVISNKKDYIFAKEIYYKYLEKKNIIFNFSSVFNKLKPSQLAKWILKDQIDVRLNLQLHKYIWHPSRQGV